MRCLYSICFILSVLVIEGSGSRILGAFLSPSKSHLIIHMEVVKPLLERGHDVTVLSTIPIDYTHLKLRHILIAQPGFAKEIIKEMIEKPKGRMAAISGIFMAISFMLDYGNTTLGRSEIKAFLNDPRNEFDLVILGAFFNNFHMGLASHFNCPIILSWMVQPVGYLHKLVGNPSELSYAPVWFLEGMQPMNFLSRVNNFVFGLLESTMDALLIHKTRALYNHHFPPDKYRSFDDTLRNVSLIFSAHHFNLGPIRPNVPAVIEIGGIQVEGKTKSLPEDLQNFMDNANDGVIYFCMGSNVPTSALRPEVIKAIFNVFKNLKQRVVMKWEEDQIPVQSSNVFFSKWLPQSDLLSHPNLKLFITHGGYGGIVEAKHRGVPIIGLPIFGDQLSNVHKVEHDGWGLRLNLDTLTEHNLRTAIREIINNSTYRDHAKTYSSLYKDRQTTSQENVVFWTEYVIRHRGAPHMQSPAVHMNFIEYYSLDVTLFLSVLGYVLIKLIAFLFKGVYQLIFMKNKRKIKTN